MNKIVKLTIYSIFTLILVLAGCRSVDQAVEKTDPVIQEADKEAIIYGFDGKIWQMNSNGTDNKILIEADFPVTWPKVSPDGSRILVIGHNDKTMSLWIASLQGKDLKPVSPEFDAVNGYWINPTILLVSVTMDIGLEYGNPEEYFILDINTNTMENYPDTFEAGIGEIISSRDSWITSLDGVLTLHTLDHKSALLFPDWVVADSRRYDISPSGQEIIFQGVPLSASPEDIEYSIYQGLLDNNQEPEKIFVMDCCVSFHWSPDAQKIAIFSSADDDVVTVIDSQTHETLITFNLDVFVQGKYGWASNNKEFLISGNYATTEEDRNFELAKINMDTGEVTRLTDNNKRESNANWVVIN